MPQAVYIHIPFCHRLCPYCDFTKYVYKGQPVQQYIDVLKKEMAFMAHRYPPQELQSIFVGGGTPTALSLTEMEQLLGTIATVFPAQASSLEFTMEANPEGVDEALLTLMKEGGVNRLSLGVQTFEPSLLKKLGRMHAPEQVFQVIKLAKAVGFTNISIDLMFGLPGQTLAMLEESIEVTFSLGIPHVSIYSLKVEEGTFFHTLEQKGKLLLPTEDEEADMYQLVLNKMKEKGYIHYEISNFAQPGCEGRHNLTYWRNEEYFGFGTGAHGYVQGTRFVNTSSLAEYIEMVEKEGVAQIEKHPVSRREAMEETMILGLRMAQGVSKKDFQTRYGVCIEEIFGSELRTLMSEELLAMDGSRYYLTSKGLFWGNEVFARFLKEIE